MIVCVYDRACGASTCTDLENIQLVMYLEYYKRGHNIQRVLTSKSATELRTEKRLEKYRLNMETP